MCDKAREAEAATEAWLATDPGDDASYERGQEAFELVGWVNNYAINEAKDLELAKLGRAINPAVGPELDQLTALIDACVGKGYLTTHEERISAERDQIVDEIVSGGGSREQADCVADRVEAAGVEADVRSLSEKDATAVFRIVLECFTGGALPSECYLDAILDVAGAESFKDLWALRDASRSVTVDQRIELFEASFVCQGATPAVARCITDAMLKEFGRDIFESTRLELTLNQEQAALQEIRAACAPDVASADSGHEFSGSA
jgi:hypothetical protein